MVVFSTSLFLWFSELGFASGGVVFCGFLGFWQNLKTLRFDFCIFIKWVIVFTCFCLLVTEKFMGTWICFCDGSKVEKLGSLYLLRLFISELLVDFLKALLKQNIKEIN